MPKWNREKVRELDAEDALAPLRSLFTAPAGTIYFNGNSLGLCSKPVERAVQDALDDWRSLAIEGWFEGPRPWLAMSDKVAAQMAPLVGADPDEVTTANSTTVNLHQFLATLYRPAGQRKKILIDETIFCSDRYAIESHLRLRQLNPADDLVVVPTVDGLLLSEDALIERMADDVVFALFPSVVYHTGQLLDMERLTSAAHQRGITIGFDCCHSVGCVPHELSRWGADFAFWSGYKYLNAGPGAVAGLYLNRRHFECSPGLAGWFGCRKERLLEMPPHLDSADGAERLQISTPFILSMAPLVGSLSTISQAGIHALRAKSLRLTDLLIDLADDRLRENHVSLITPREERRRGGHIALAHPQAERLFQELGKRKVVMDYRRPNILRLAPHPLYTSFEDCFEAMERLASIFDEL